MVYEYFLGVDGGGTGCRARIVDRAGHCIGSGTSGPATMRLGTDAAMMSVMSAVAQATHDAGLAKDAFTCMAAGLALAGANRNGAKEQILAYAHPFASVHIISDAMGALLGAHSGRDGAVVIAGTGSVGIGLVKGRELRVGGYGFPVSDEGSGAYLGLRAVQLALRAHDGRGQNSQMLDLLMQRFDGLAYGVVAWMDRASASDYAELAPLVLQHAARQDIAAESIARCAAAHIDAMVAALMDRGAPRVSLLGGVSLALRDWMQPSTLSLLKSADGDAVDGAIIHARNSVGGA